MKQLNSTWTLATAATAAVAMSATQPVQAKLFENTVSLRQARVGSRTCSERAAGQWSQSQLRALIGR